MSEEKPRKTFIPGGVVRVRGQIMSVGLASLRGLLDEADTLESLTQAERIAAREGVALEAADKPAAEGDPQPELTPGQKAAATRAANKAKREAVLKAGKNPADVDAEGAEEESKLGETSKPPVEPGTIGGGTPPPGTDPEDVAFRRQADGTEDPKAEAPEVSDEATDAEVEAAEAEAGQPEPAPEFATQDAEAAALADEDVPTSIKADEDGS